MTAASALRKPGAGGLCAATRLGSTSRTVPSRRSRRPHAIAARREADEALGRLYTFKGGCRTTSSRLEHEPVREGAGGVEGRSPPTRRASAQGVAHRRRPGGGREGRSVRRRGRVRALDLAAVVSDMPDASMSDIVVGHRGPGERPGGSGAVATGAQILIDRGEHDRAMAMAQRGGGVRPVHRRDLARQTQVAGSRAWPRDGRRPDRLGACSEDYTAAAKRRAGGRSGTGRREPVSSR